MKQDVTLSGYEMLLAGQAGVMRQVEAIRRGRKDAYGFKGDAWGVHIEGAGGELAVAKLVGAYWNACVRNPDELPGDVGNYEVRTPSRPNSRLIVHPQDPDDRPFVLVTGTMPNYTIHGYILGSDAKQQQWWEDPVGGRPAYFVPQSALLPMSQEPLVPA